MAVPLQVDERCGSGTRQLGGLVEVRVVGDGLRVRADVIPHGCDMVCNFGHDVVVGADVTSDVLVSSGDVDRSRGIAHGEVDFPPSSIRTSFFAFSAPEQ